MATTRAGARKAPVKPRQRRPAAKPKTVALPALPPLKLARFKEVGRELERLVESNTDVFIEAGNRFRERHRAAGGRPLTPLEIGQLAAGLSTTLAVAKEQVETAGLEAYDEPDPLQLLLAAGAGTASVWVEGLQRIVAIIEMGDGDFRAVRESGTLAAAVDDAVLLLDDLDMVDAQARTKAAMEHLAAGSGVPAGEAWGLLTRSAWQALQQAGAHLRTIPSTSSLTPSPASTTGPETTSSTASPGLS